MFIEVTHNHYRGHVEVDNVPGPPVHAKRRQDTVAAGHRCSALPSGIHRCHLIVCPKMASGSDSKVWFPKMPFQTRNWRRSQPSKVKAFPRMHKGRTSAPVTPPSAPPSVPRNSLVSMSSNGRTHADANHPENRCTYRLFFQHADTHHAPPHPPSTNEHPHRNAEETRAAIIQWRLPSQNPNILNTASTGNDLGSRSNK